MNAMMKASEETKTDIQVMFSEYLKLTLQTWGSVFAEWDTREVEYHLFFSGKQTNPLLSAI